MGTCYNKLGKIEDAIKCFERSVQAEAARCFAAGLGSCLRLAHCSSSQATAFPIGSGQPRSMTASRPTRAARRCI